MKKTFILLFVLVAFLSNAQTTTSAKFGSMYKDRKDGLFNTLLYSDGKFSYYVRYEAVGKARFGKVIIEKYGEDLKRQKVSESMIKNDDGREIFLFKSVYLNGKVIIIYGKKVSAFTLSDYAFSMTMDGKCSEPVLIQEKNTNYLTYCASKDKSRLFCYATGSYTGSTVPTFPIKVYDDNLKLLWESNTKLPYDSKDITIEDAGISANDNLYFLVKKRIAGAKGETCDNFEYKVVSITDKGKKVSVLDLNFDNGFHLFKNYMTVMDDDHIFLEGYLSQKNDVVSGYAHISINGTTMKFNFNKAGGFSEGFEKQIFEERDYKGANASTSLPDINDIDGKSDGGYVVFRFINNKTPRPHCAVIITNIDSKGNEVWNSSFPIGFFQNSLDNENTYDMYNHGLGFLEFNAFPYNGKYYILYGDAKSNISAKTKSQSVEFNYKESILALAVVDENGAVTRQIVHTPAENADELKAFYRPSNFTQFNNEVILDKRNKDTFIPGRIILK